MGAILSGMMRSPFTAILFCLELTHDANVLLPLLIATLCSYAFTVLVMKRSILTEKIARRGFDIFREYSVDPLERYQVKDIMSSCPQVVDAKMPLRQLIDEKFGSGRHRGYPIVVTAPEGTTKVIGMVVASDLAHIPGLEDLSKLTAQDLVQKAPITISAYETCRAAADVMAERQVGRILVMDGTSGRLVGIVTRSDLLKARHHHLKEESQLEKFIIK